MQKARQNKPISHICQNDLGGISLNLLMIFKSWNAQNYLVRRARVAPLSASRILIDLPGADGTWSERERARSGRSQPFTAFSEWVFHRHSQTAHVSIVAAVAFFSSSSSLLKWEVTGKNGRKQHCSLPLCWDGVYGVWKECSCPSSGYNSNNLIHLTVFTWFQVQLNLKRRWLNLFFHSIKTVLDSM